MKQALRKCTISADVTVTFQTPLHQIVDEGGSISLCAEIVSGTSSDIRFAVGLSVTANAEG